MYQVLKNFKREYKKFLSLGLVLSIVVVSGYIYLEPQLAEALAVTNTVVVTMQVDTGISISSPGNTSMSTSLGVSSNTAVATTTWNVATNDTAGYTLAVQASTLPAMKSAADSVPDAGASQALWSVSSGTSQFGYSGFGTDVPTGTWGTGSFCNGAATSTVSTTLKYRGFTTSPVTIASRASTTTPSGINSTICYAVGQNNTYIPSGTYTATITATATAL